MRQLRSTSFLLAFLLLYAACLSATGSSRVEIARRLAASSALTGSAGDALATVPPDCVASATQP